MDIPAKPQTSREYLVSGARCAGCVATIESTLAALPGVTEAQMNFALRTVTVHGEADEDLLVGALKQAGYGAEPVVADHVVADTEASHAAGQAIFRQQLRDTALALAVGIPLMLYGLLGGDMSVRTGSQQFAWGIVGLLTLGVLVGPGRHFFIGALRSFRDHAATMDTLIALGTGTAWFYSMVVVLFPGIVPEPARHLYFEASAMIIGLVGLGTALEARARGKTSLAINRLLNRQPPTARVQRDGKEIDVPLADVVVGDTVRIRPGEQLPVDGTVIEGRSSVDESMLTGEPMPVEKQPGESLSAGTLNRSGSLLYRATRVGRDTALARIVTLVRQAQNSRPPIGRLADRISGWFVPGIMIIAVLSALAWINFGPEPAMAFAVVSATTVLIIACPCALGLATPMSVMVGVGKAAEYGVLVRNGEAMQKASRIDTVVLDKTGTITRGAPSVTRVLAASGRTGEEILGYAAALEASSEHPLAVAVLDRARERGIEPMSVAHFESHTGRGVSGVTQDGTRVLLGNDRLMRDHGIDFSGFTEQADALAGAASTPIYLALDNEAGGLIAIADPVRDDSTDAIKRLQASGIRVVMLTGDNATTAEAVAHIAGVDDFGADLSPQGKVDRIAALQSEGAIVGMAGDGINDAPALARADVGFAIGSGTDVAIESADITLMRDSLDSLADAIEISRATLRNIHQNLFGAFIYNSIGVPVAAGALYPAFGLLLNPVVAGAAMAFSSLTVVTNANRLRLFRPAGERS